jgi:hypothetical protein
MLHQAELNSVVMARLDRAIQGQKSQILWCDVDGRVKPGHDNAASI